LKKLSYIDWIQFETTRHYGPVNGNFARVATEDHYIGKIPVKKGTLMAMQPMGNHYNPKYFKDPFTFQPERW
jgi:cytochrome P450 family 3 subfamily A